MNDNTKKRLEHAEREYRRFLEEDQAAKAAAVLEELLDSLAIDPMVCTMVRGEHMAAVKYGLNDENNPFFRLRDVLES